MSPLTTDHSPLTTNHSPLATTTGRYAPSPTGPLHLGNIRTAIAAWKDIRERGGVFILRIEDNDLPRNRPGAEESIIDDLRWIGIDWDEGPDIGGPSAPYRQSKRDHIYRDALYRLRRQGLIYPCTCSRKDLQSSAAAPHGPEGPIYPGTCRNKKFDLSSSFPSSASESESGASSASPSNNLTTPDAPLTDFLAAPPNQRNASLRIRTDILPPVTFHDEIHGERRYDLAAESGDFVVLRRDGLWAYQFVCAVDDALMGITRVVRGDDLLSSTPRQASIIRALGFEPPLYRHIPLMLDEEGSRMSKREGSQGLQLLKDKGMTPAQAMQHLAMPA